ncbi:hypothetical protein CH373_03005 [Leptospira perolatii]|uniref:Uncharacterized protein n=1 Tax=Leptospira perolatii TaxID=2023191 RepID=A0A2M9ZSF5_9LEPT|nr:hypothetical protein [Leptospira perolatii]PJZ71475.1 hypothetical protein CH360_03000 [Leptospira perolatii]PJZ75010.1 hypothetical protein CH373_03005 [Leptospira perolatii]
MNLSPPSSLFILAGIFVFVSCLTDPVWKLRDEERQSRIPRSEASSRFYAAVVLKSGSCPSAYQAGIQYGGVMTMGEVDCTDETFLESVKELRSCESRYSFIDGGSLNTCLEEVFLTPCESFSYSASNSVPLLYFPVCSEVFKTNPLRDYL